MNVINATLKRCWLMVVASLVARSAYNELFENNPSNGLELLVFVGFFKPFPVPL